MSQRGTGRVVRIVGGLYINKMQALTLFNSAEKHVEETKGWV
ncbi:hypothetical protein [Paenibacillus polysaccharolyticus]|nr:hypothetical protein [Paenibacillus polysaccharolyticus]